MAVPTNPPKITHKEIKDLIELELQVLHNKYYNISNMKPFKEGIYIVKKQFSKNFKKGDPVRIERKKQADNPLFESFDGFEYAIINLKNKKTKFCTRLYEQDFLKKYFQFFV